MSKKNPEGRVLGRVLAQEQIENVSGGYPSGTDYSADSSASGESPFPTYPGEGPQTLTTFDNPPTREN